MSHHRLVANVAKAFHHAKDETFAQALPFIAGVSPASGPKRRDSDSNHDDPACLLGFTDPLDLRALLEALKTIDVGVAVVWAMASWV